MNLPTRIIGTVTRASSLLRGNARMLEQQAHPLLDAFAKIARQGAEDAEVFQKGFTAQLDRYRLRGSPRLDFKEEIIWIGGELTGHLQSLNTIYSRMESMPQLSAEIQENEEAIRDIETMLAAVSLYPNLADALEAAVSDFPAS